MTSVNDFTVPVIDDTIVSLPFDVANAPFKRLPLLAGHWHDRVGARFCPQAKPEAIKADIEKLI